MGLFKYDISLQLQSLKLIDDGYSDYKVSWLRLRDSQRNNDEKRTPKGEIVKKYMGQRPV